MSATRLGLAILGAAIVSIGALGEPSAEPVSTAQETPIWLGGIGLGLGSLALMGDADQTLSGTSFELCLAASRRFRETRWAVQLETCGSVVGEPNYKSTGRDARLEGATALGLFIAAGAAFIPNRRWSVSLAVGPAIALVSSPRVIAATEWGFGLSGSLTRVWSLGHGFVVGGAVRATIAALGEGTDQWTSLAGTLHLVGQWRY